MNLSFDKARHFLDCEFTSAHWIDGQSEEELRKAIASLEEEFCSRSLCKARTLEYLAHHAPIAIDENDIFQDKLNGFRIMIDQRRAWAKEVKDRYFPEEAANMAQMWDVCGAYRGAGDFGHTSPNSRLLLEVGFSGLLEKIKHAASREDLNEEQKEYYLSCKIVLEAVMHVAKRLSTAVAPINIDNAKALESISSSAPTNIYEALQLLILYFFLHDYVGGTRVRTLGRVDLLLYPFYLEDLRTGKYTRAQVKEMLKFFLYKFWVAKVPFDLPFCLGGIDADGNEATNEISYLIVEAYNELNIHSPKIHIRISDKTPKSFIKLVLSCIRGGNSSFVFVNDKIGIESLVRVGITENEARDFVPIGCYEPTVWGVELGCSDNGGINLAKAVELVFNNGKDLSTGTMCGIGAGKIESFDAFKSAVKKQIAHMTERALSYIVKIEKHYGKINPDPLLSCQYTHSVSAGVDVYAGGAKYNNSSMYFYSIASLVDSLCAVKRMVFEDGKFTFDELGEILRNNWQGNEKERAVALRLKEKYGNNNLVADMLTKEFAEFCAGLVNNKPNGRGGVFKAALFSVDTCFYIGKKTMATPDGRCAGEPLSKNLCATVGMDKRGVTALINSVTKIDHADFPTGSVLDIMLHPSAVSGEDGLEAFFGILMTYFKKGGFAMHGNIFDAKILKDAQAHPDQYQTLQVRVCGWNTYFVNLSKTEQDCFIRQAEGLV